jgi:hypothetical protein
MSNPTIDPPKKHDLNALNSLYLDGDSVDQEVFAEYRSNILLVAGEHYNRRQSSFYRRIRDSRELSQEQKMRLTKNHIQKICKTYVNNILSTGPNVGFEPKDEQNLQNQKEADLNHSVWRDAWERYGLDDLRDDWCDDFVNIGEVATKIVWDPDAGPITAYQQKLSDAGNPLHYDEDQNETAEAAHPVTGQPREMVPDPSLQVHQGEFIFDTLYAFNLLRPAECKDMKKAAWLCIRKMSNRDYLLNKYQADDTKAAMIISSGDETFMVYEGARAGYRKTDTEVLIREFYFRPCVQYPKGYYYISTKNGILEEGELPGGIFPIIVQPLEKIQTTPRGRSPVKQMRPYQAEINRAASKMAEHQITLGDDKLLLSNGSKTSAGIALPGVRSINFTGQAPTVLQGRSGAQYLEYMNSQIQELYTVMNVAEDTAVNKETGQMDPYAMLFRAAKQKKAFQRHIQRFNKFLLDVAKTYLKLAKLYLPDDQLIYAVGKSEQINIPEFKNTRDASFDIIIDQQTDDIETKMGKQLVLNHAIQYVGHQLKPDDIGKLLREMPYGNLEKSMDDFTIDYDSSVNDILALDRGSLPPVHPYDNHVYVVKRLVARMRQADFQFLSPQIQQAYQQKIQLHEQLEAQRQMQIQQAEQGYIPTGGYLVSCQFYVADPSDPSGQKSRQARLPAEAVQWLIQHLESQGQSLQQMESMNPGAQQEVSNMMSPMKAGPPNPHAPMPGPGTPQHQPMQPQRAMLGAGNRPPSQMTAAPNGMGAGMSTAAAGMARRS